MKYIVLITIFLIQLLDFQSANATNENLKEIKIGEKVPDITLWGSAGKRYKFKKYKGAVIVLEWIDYTCDKVKESYDSGEIQDIQQVFVVRSDVLWASVHSVTEDDKRYKKQKDVWQKTMDDKAYPDTVIIDNKLRASKVFGIKKIPAFVVIDAEGRLAYKGKLKDDKHNYVTEAVGQLLSLDDVDISETSITEGCDL